MLRASSTCARHPWAVTLPPQASPRRAGDTRTRVIHHLPAPESVGGTPVYRAPGDCPVPADGDFAPRPCAVRHVRPARARSGAFGGAPQSLADLAGLVSLTVHSQKDRSES